MYLKELELSGFKSFAKKRELEFSNATTAIVGPNGSGKSNIAEAFRFVLGEQSMKSMRGKKGEDLIWGGSQSVPRSGRASVKVVFDNTDRTLDIDYDEVSIERTVHRDGANEYAINGSLVRLKDVVELLAGANIGASGHHIISQGEADRILSASTRERREMIEDALALKVYQYKKQESQKKLDKTRENIGQVESLRKEIQPHLKFLEKQVAKIEQSKELRDDLLARYLEYFKREDLYLDHERRSIEASESEPKAEYERLERELAAAKETLAAAEGGDEKGKEVLDIENKLSGVRKRKDELSRELGRLEGQIAAEERVERTIAKTVDTLPKSEVATLADELESLGEDQALDLAALRERLRSILGRLRSLLSGGSDQATPADGDALATLYEKKTTLERDLAGVEEEEQSLESSYAALKESIDSERDKERGAEREVFRISSRLAELRNELNELKHRRERLELEDAEFKRELGEVAPLVGRAVTDYQNHEIGGDGGVVSDTAILEEARSAQEERKRTLERMKIRLEELAGSGSEEILKEHEEVKSRDEFLSHEVEDLERSADSLLSLIAELDEKLDTKFKEGLTKINKEFQTFFALMFGGGTATLSVVKERRRRRATEEEPGGDDEEEAVEEGIDIAISLPHKRIKGLEMLSGGERALTSIALIFAMSQVNPPPFLILDETDAALDEANSRRYGDMIDNLSKKSQLILITHNRETMSRAGVLYGVTMGSDGISKLLSVKFDEAVAVAK